VKVAAVFVVRPEQRNDLVENFIVRLFWLPLVFAT
jgi:hypothetical protein